MPSVRDFAMQTKVNPNTMQKALSELEDDQIIYTERTNGKFVTEDENIIAEFKEKLANENVSKYFKNMKDIGVNEKEAIEYLLKQGGKD